MDVPGWLRRHRWFASAIAGTALCGLVGGLIAFVMSGSTSAGYAGPASAGGSGSTSAGDTMGVMTYNLRGAPDPPPRDWHTRLPVVEQVLRRHDPDLIGVQEAQWSQMRDLEREVPAYAWVGMGAQGGTEGEFSAIFYRKDRFELLDFDDFWLSDTPQVIGSSTWGNRYTRIATWAKLRDRRDGRVFYQLNTHLDDLSANSQLKSAELILNRVRGFQAGVPVLVTGDFNTFAGTSQPYKVLTGPNALQDTWTTAQRRGPVYRTYNGWHPPVRNGYRIDWILSRGDVRTLSTEIDTYRRHGIYPSDHYPVVAQVALGGGGGATPTTAARGA